MTSLGDVLADARADHGRDVDLPLLVDIDTGWGHAFTIDRAVRELERAGVAAVQIEDQAGAKRCGHRPGKAGRRDRRRWSSACARRRRAVATSVRGRRAHRCPAVEGLDHAIERAVALRGAGADVIFAEALTHVEDCGAFTAALDVPVLANITEFGLTPFFTLDELRDAGSRSRSIPSRRRALRRGPASASTRRFVRDGTQAGVLDEMQTRDELYDVLDYLRFERALDAVRERGRLSRPEADELLVDARGYALEAGGFAQRDARDGATRARRLARLCRARVDA